MGTPPQGASTTAPNPLHPRSPLVFAVVWLVFTSGHATFMVQGFRSNPFALLFLLAFYSVFFGVGFAMLLGHLRWWRQSLTLGAPRLRTHAGLRAAVPATFVLQGFKEAAQRADLKAYLVRESGTRDGDGDLVWAESWRSEGAALQWLPHAGAVQGQHRLQAQATVRAPEAMTRKPGTLVRWSLLVLPPTPNKPGEAATRVEKLKQGWRYDLPEAALALVAREDEPSSEASITPMSANDRAQAVRVMTMMATLFIGGGLAWLGYVTLGSGRFSPFAGMFAITFALAGGLMAVLANALHQGAAMHMVSSRAHQAMSTAALGPADVKVQIAMRRFKQIVKVLPALFMLAFAWEALGDWLLRALGRG